jgi:predicted ABC-type ATPase
MMLERIQELTARGENPSFETTLASRTFAPLLRTLADQGYTTYLLYYWLPSADLAIARVAERVRRGGHHVPADVIRRRYQRGLSNFFTLYRSLADVWRVYDSSGWPPVLVAHRLYQGEEHVLRSDTWQVIQQGARNR